MPLSLINLQAFLLNSTYTTRPFFLFWIPDIIRKPFLMLFHQPLNDIKTILRPKIQSSCARLVLFKFPKLAKRSGHITQFENFPHQEPITKHKYHLVLRLFGLCLLEVYTCQRKPCTQSRETLPPKSTDSTMSVC